MNLYEKLSIYIAGPECFYPQGYSLWHAQRQLAEYYGFNVVLPNNTPLKLDHEDKRLNADAIFENLKKVIHCTDIIIADLEFFRSTEADSGTVFELGMAYAQGALLYGYTRDKRSMAKKNQFCELSNTGKIIDQEEQIHGYPDLPYAPSISASTMIIEGDFHDCLKMVIADLEERRKKAYVCPSFDKSTKLSDIKHNKPLIFLSGPDRYYNDGEFRYASMKDLCLHYGFDSVTPLDGMSEIVLETEDPLERAVKQFLLWQNHLKDCDIFIGDLRDYHGWEPCNDTAFEAGAAWMLKKRAFCYMPEKKPMLERIPHFNGLDVSKNIVENFSYPVNLMFASSMPIIQGGLENVLRELCNGQKMF